MDDVVFKGGIVPPIGSNGTELAWHADKLSNALLQSKPNCLKLLWLNAPELCSSGDPKKDGCYIAITTESINCFPMIKIRRFL